MIDIREHATDKHRSVDDTPAGGGPGMVMKADVLARAVDAAGSRLPAAPSDDPARRAADASRVEALAAGAGTSSSAAASKASTSA